MLTIKRASLPLLLALLGVFACVLPGVTNVSPSALDTAVAETMAVIIQLTQDAGSGVSFDQTDTPTPPLTITLTQTATPTETATITPSATSTNTLLPLTPMISVSIPTNCRLGPGKIYKQVGALLVGQVVQVYARSVDNEYWYIRNPDKPSQFCWVWGEYATLSGSIYTLPIFTPPPTPTFTATYTPTAAPGFSATFSDLQSCSGWWVDISLQNTGSVTFKSVQLIVRDTVNAAVVKTTLDGFTVRTGCSASSHKNALQPGKTALQSSARFGYNLDGRKLRANITLCTGTGLGGTCVNKVIVFTP